MTKELEEQLAKVTAERDEALAFLSEATDLLKQFHEATNQIENAWNKLTEQVEIES